jgi:phosphate transport system permease protein
MILSVLAIIARGGLGFFWPADLIEYRLTDGTAVLGEAWEAEKIPEGMGSAEGARRIRIRAGNRQLYGEREFRWVDESLIESTTRPTDAVLIKKDEYGDFLGYVDRLTRDGEVVATSVEAVRRVQALLPEVADARKALVEVRSREDDPDRMAELEGFLRGHVLDLRTADGLTTALPIGDVYRIYRPNDLGWFQELGVYLSRTWEFVSTSPREANLEGGILPAIFGTVLMTFLMTLAVVPLGVLAGLYLREYARQGRLVKAVRIAVNNLAGVPSIVFGIFGLGFFIYVMGATVDETFFGNRLPTPTFGTGGILWAALTLALLTVPVVIVATEEGLAAVPRAVREGSLALGASKWETTWRVVLPAATPGILTGVILAISRAAGEVAPLMMVGAVKTATDLPLDGEFPFLHLERKFMHLGFHVYDLGFQSPNVEAAKPMVYMTTLLLVAIVVLLNLLTMWIRNRLWNRYRSASF